MGPFGNSLVVQRLRIHLPLQGTPVQSLAAEPRPYTRQDNKVQEPQLLRAHTLQPPNHNKEPGTAIPRAPSKTRWGQVSVNVVYKKEKKTASKQGKNYTTKANKYASLLMGGKSGHVRQQELQEIQARRKKSIAASKSSRHFTVLDDLLPSSPKGHAVPPPQPGGEQAIRSRYKRHERQLHPLSTTLLL